MGDMFKDLGRRFGIKFEATFGQFERDVKDQKTWNNSDAVVYLPIIREFPNDPSCGKKIMALYSVDGLAKEPVPDFEIFEAMLFIGSSLLASSEISVPYKKEISKFLLNISTVKSNSQAKNSCADLNFGKAEDSN